MGILQKFVRPVKLFDVNDKKHRKYYAEYLKTNSWGNCPFQLTSPTKLISLSSYAREQLIQYYINKEFNND